MEVQLSNLFVGSGLCCVSNVGTKIIKRIESSMPLADIIPLPRVAPAWDPSLSVLTSPPSIPHPPQQKALLSLCMDWDPTMDATTPRGTGGMQGTRSW